MLGADVGDGATRAVATCVKRGVQARKRATHLRALLKEGAIIVNVHRAGPTTSWLWGCEVAGLAPASLHAARVASLKAGGNFSRGTSVGLRLGLKDTAVSLDPLALYVCKLVSAWTETIWQASPALGLLHVVWDSAKEKLSTDAPWSRVVSPDQVLLKCLLALGWRPKDAKHLGNRRRAGT